MPKASTFAALIASQVIDSDSIPIITNAGENKRLPISEARSAVGPGWSATVNTYNETGITDEIKIQAAISRAVSTGADRVFIPTSMLPYDASLITFNTAVQMVREGGDFSVWDVQAYGATGNGIVNDQVPIQKCSDEVRARVVAGEIPTIVFTGQHGYAIGSTVTLPTGAHVIMDAALIYTGSADEPAIVYGLTAEYASNRHVQIRVRRSTTSSWLDEDSIGAKLLNLDDCFIEIIQAESFTIGVQMYGDTKGCNYNLVTLSSIRGNKKQLVLTSNAGSCNENLFLNGKFASFTGVGAGLSRYGVVITSVDGYVQNNNIFLKPSFELSDADADPSETISVLITRGQGNQFLYCRDEGNGETFSRIENDSTENFIQLGYGTGLLDDQSTAPANTLINLRTLKSTMELGPTVFASGPLHKLACWADGSSSINVPTVHCGAYGDAFVYADTNLMTLNARYLDVGRAVGIFVDTSRAKNLIVSRDVETGRGGRVYVACFDDSGTIITTAGSVKGSVFNAFTYDSGSFGGSWGTGADSTGDIFVNVTAAVKYVRVLCAAGTLSLRIRSFAIRAPGVEGAASWTGLEILDQADRFNVGTAAPTAGTWAKGRVVYDATPDASGFIGWVCTTAGTPGTWKTFGAISA